MQATVQAARGIYAELGMKGFYHALPVQLVCEGAGRGLYFSSYEVLKGAFGLQHINDPSSTQSSHPLLKRLAAATLSGMSMWTVMMPFDVIRSNTMVIKPSKGTPAPSMMHIARQLYT